jgi:hypothetical protein
VHGNQPPTWLIRIPLSSDLVLCALFNSNNHKHTPHPLDMSTGLTRRRGGGGGVASAENDNGDSSRVASPAPKAGGSRDTGGPETSYESGENGHKIAFDPRDISESTERSKQPKLTLMEEVLLLGLKDKQVGGWT